MDLIKIKQCIENLDVTHFINRCEEFGLEIIQVSECSTDVYSFKPVAAIYFNDNVYVYKYYDTGSYILFKNFNFFKQNRINVYTEKTILQLLIKIKSLQS